MPKKKENVIIDVEPTENEEMNPQNLVVPEDLDTTIAQQMQQSTDKFNAVLIAINEVLAAHYCQIIENDNKQTGLYDPETSMVLWLDNSNGRYARMNAYVMQAAMEAAAAQEAQEDDSDVVREVN